MHAFRRLAACTSCALLLGLGSAAHAAPTLVNGGFEAGLAGWTVVDQTGGEGTFFVQVGAASPVLGDAVPTPPQGAVAAMSDGAGPGSHVLYQDFPAIAGPATLRFDLFLGNRADRYATPDSLDFALTSQTGAQTRNQQVRVDILRAGALPFSVDAADVLLTLYRAQVGDALVAGYFAVAADLGGLLAAHDGESLRLRFAETDNLEALQMGVDDVRFEAASVAAPGSALMLCTTALAALGASRRRSRAAAPARDGAATRPC